MRYTRGLLFVAALFFLLTLRAGTVNASLGAADLQCSTNGDYDCTYANGGKATDKAGEECFQNKPCSEIVNGTTISGVCVSGDTCDDKNPSEQKKTPGVTPSETPPAASPPPSEPPAAPASSAITPVEPVTPESPTSPSEKASTPSAEGPSILQDVSPDKSAANNAPNLSLQSPDLSDTSQPAGPTSVDQALKSAENSEAGGAPQQAAPEGQAPGADTAEPAAQKPAANDSAVNLGSISNPGDYQNLAPGENPASPSYNSQAAPAGESPTGEAPSTFGPDQTPPPPEPAPAGCGSFTSCAVKDVADAASNVAKFVGDSIMPSANAEPYNPTLGQTIADVSSMTCQAVGCNPALMQQWLGGICGIESNCNPDVSHVLPGPNNTPSNYQGAFQVGLDETQASIAALQQMALSPNLSPSQQAQFGNAASAAQAMLDNGKNPNADPTLSVYLAAGYEQANNIPSQVSSLAGGDPQKAVGLAMLGQLAPGNFANNSSLGLDSKIGPVTAGILNSNGYLVTPGMTIDQVSNVVLSAANTQQGGFRIDSGINFAAGFNSANVSPSIDTSSSALAFQGLAAPSGVLAGEPIASSIASQYPILESSPSSAAPVTPVAASDVAPLSAYNIPPNYGNPGPAAPFEANYPAPAGANVSDQAFAAGYNVSNPTSPFYSPTQEFNQVGTDLAPSVQLEAPQSHSAGEIAFQNGPEAGTPLIGDVGAQPQGTSPLPSSYNSQALEDAALNRYASIQNGINNVMQGLPTSNTVTPLSSQDILAQYSGLNDSLSPAFLQQSPSAESLVQAQQNYGGSITPSEVFVSAPDEAHASAAPSSVAQEAGAPAPAAPAVVTPEGDHAIASDSTGFPVVNSSPDDPILKALQQQVVGTQANVDDTVKAGAFWDSNPELAQLQMSACAAAGGGDCSPLVPDVGKAQQALADAQKGLSDYQQGIISPSIADAQARISEGQGAANSFLTNAAQYLSNFGSENVPQPTGSSADVVVPPMNALGDREGPGQTVAASAAELRNIADFGGSILAAVPTGVNSGGQLISDNVVSMSPFNGTPQVEAAGAVNPGLRAVQQAVDVANGGLVLLGAYDAVQSGASALFDVAKSSFAPAADDLGSLARAATPDLLMQAPDLAVAEPVQAAPTAIAQAPGEEKPSGTIVSNPPPESPPPAAAPASPANPANPGSPDKTPGAPASPPPASPPAAPPAAPVAAKTPSTTAPPASAGPGTSAPPAPSAPKPAVPASQPSAQSPSAVISKALSGLENIGSSILQGLGSALSSILKALGAPSSSQPPPAASPSAPTNQIPIVSLIPYPPAVASGATSLLSWSSIGTMQCTVTDPMGNQIAAGASDGNISTPAITATTVFTVTCTTSSGSSISGTTTVLMQQGPQS